MTQWRGRWSVTQKPQTIVKFTTENACKLQTNSSKFRFNSFDICYQGSHEKPAEAFICNERRERAKELEYFIEISNVVVLF